MLQERLRDILRRIKEDTPTDLFTGAGIVIYKSLENLPIIKMGIDSRIENKIVPSSSISESSQISNKSHDGFNFISSYFRITHKNMYFSPPIDSSVKFHLTKGYGTRYVTALMGSVLPDVIMTAVVSNSYGIVIFEDGKVIYEEPSC